MTLAKSFHFSFLTYKAELKTTCVKGTIGNESQYASQYSMTTRVNYTGFAAKRAQTMSSGTQMAGARICRPHLLAYRFRTRAVAHAGDEEARWFLLDGRYVS